MSDIEPVLRPGDISPGDERVEDREIVGGLLGYLVGLGLAALITVFGVSGSRVHAITFKVNVRRP